MASNRIEKKHAKVCYEKRLAKYYKALDAAESYFYIDDWGDKRLIEIEACDRCNAWDYPNGWSRGSGFYHLDCGRNAYDCECGE